MSMFRLFACVVLVVTTSTAARAQQADFSKVELSVVPVDKNIYMITGGQGGNIGMCVGDDGIVLIDDMFAPLSDKIIAAVKSVSDKPIKVLLNTHFHGDHTGANAAFGKMGVTIVAHDNTFQRLSTEQTSALSGRKTPPAPKDAWPVVSFPNAMTVHMCGYTIEAMNIGPAHTDTDIAIHFVEANVYHMGDTYFSEAYPFIDVGSGGTINGLIATMDQTIAKLDAKAKVIPGHGKLSDRAGMKTYRDMLVTIRDRIQKAMTEGKDFAAINAMKPTAEFDKAWGSGFMNADFVTRTIYESLKKG